MRRATILAASLLLVVAQTALADGEFSAAGKRKFRKQQKLPISLGTSGGNVTAVDATSCSSGTLGGLIEKETASGVVQYVVSNNHVLAEGNKADKGDRVNQPGLIDVNCRDQPERYVAELSGWTKLKFGGSKRNKVDLAIAEVLPGMVSANGRILKIGVPGSLVISPTLGLEVKKAGRTTGFTRGTVVAVGVTGTVVYDETIEAKFVNQFVVQGLNGAKFADGGDSGSLVVKDVKRCPATVGLLFAANDQGQALVNRMDQVLKAAGKIAPKGEARMVGCVPGLAPAAAAAIEALSLSDRPQPHESRELRTVRRAHRRWSDDLLDLPVVTALGIGRSVLDPDQVVLKVFVAWDDEHVRARIPSRLEGAPVELVRSGPWIAR